MKRKNCFKLVVGCWLLVVCLFVFSSQVSADTNTVIFLYDGGGQRIYRGVNGGEHTYYISPGIEVVLSSGGTISYRKSYYFSGKLVAVKDNLTGSEQVNYIHQDHLGSTTLVTSEQGTVNSQQVYFPYGSTRTTNGTLPTERQYTSQISDTDLTGLYYYNARYYNPQIAKFTQADSQGDTLNKYTYVGNNPIIYTDPSGNLINSEDKHPGNIFKYEKHGFRRGKVGVDSKGFDYNDSIFEEMRQLKANVNKRDSNLSSLFVDPVTLTSTGQTANELYIAYRDNPGWWNNFQKGTMTPADFLTLILSYELGPLAPYANNSQLSQDVAEATTRWFYSKCEFELESSSCGGASPNAIFNWIGGASESSYRRWREVFLDERGYYKSFNLEDLEKVTSPYGRNPDLALYISESIVNPPNEKWKVTEGNEILDSPYYWGNETAFGMSPKDYLWKFGTGESAWYLVTLRQKYQFK